MNRRAFFGAIPAALLAAKAAFKGESEPAVVEPVFPLITVSGSLPTDVTYTTYSGGLGATTTTATFTAL